MKNKFSSLMIGLILALCNILATENIFAAEGASRANRAKQTVEVAATIVGVHGPFATNGLHLGLNLGSSFIAEVGLHQGTYTSDYWAMKMSYGFVKLKAFLGNSFYFSFGGAQRSIEASKRRASSGILVSESSENLPDPTVFRGGEIAMGNQWQHGHFTIGCDWLGFFAGSDASKEGTEDDYEDGFHKDETDKYKDAYTKWAKQSSNPIFIRFFLGAAF